MSYCEELVLLSNGSKVVLIVEFYSKHCHIDYTNSTIPQKKILFADIDKIAADGNIRSVQVCVTHTHTNKQADKDAFFVFWR